MRALQKCALIVGLLASFLNLNIQSAAAADAQTFGDWTAGTFGTNSGLYASTINDSGLILGDCCYFSSKSRLWLLGVDSSCNDGDKYSALGNTDQGAAPLVMHCSGKLEGDSHFVMRFEDWKSLEALMQKSTRLGIAIPMQADQFKVWRFSLDGMIKAQATMESAFFSMVTPKATPPDPPKQNTSTSTL